MYKIYAGQWLLHDDRLEELKVLNPQLALEVNKTGSLEFSIYPDHPYYSTIAKLKTIITVYQDDLLLFRGRVLNDEIGFYNEKQVVCEGQLAFLLDSIIRPYDFTGSVLDYFTMLISNHNSQVEAEKQFTVGNVTVTDPNDYIVRSNIDHVNTWEEINNKLLELLGGFLQVRFEGGVAYIDYLQDFSTLSTQTVEFGKNLLDLKHIRNGESIATALIPLGAKLKDEDGNDTDQRLTIESVNDGLDYVFDDAAVDTYGWIFQTEIFDDVTDASNLMTKGQAHLASFVNTVESIELTAADLAAIDLTVDAFHIGTYVRVISEPHGIDQMFLVSKLDMNLLDPASNKLTLGGTFLGFGEALHGVYSGQGELVQTMEKITSETAEAVYNVEKNLEASIKLAEESITSTVSEKFILKDEANTLISEVTSNMVQTANGWEMLFTQVNTSLDELAAGTESEFELIRKNIRFENGSILLGQLGNLLELKISNDRISFYQSGSEVAYFSSSKLHVTNGRFINSLQMGDFAFIVQDNGNVSWKKVV